MRHAGITNPGDIKVHERPGGDALMEFKVEMSEYIFQKYLRTFNGEKEQKKVRKGDRVPEGWMS